MWGGDRRGSEELQRGTKKLLEATVMFISLVVVTVSHTHTYINTQNHMSSILYVNYTSVNKIVKINK